MTELYDEEVLSEISLLGKVMLAASDADHQLDLQEVDQLLEDDAPASA